MGKLLYLTALLLVIIWIVGYFGFHFGAAIHILLVIAVVIVIMRFFGHRNVTRN